MTERILSPDGTQYWDGSTWQHVGPETGSEHYLAATTGTAPQSPTARPSAQLHSPVEQGSRHPASPAAPHPQAQQPVSGVNSWAATKWAWPLALSPSIAFALVGPAAFFSVPDVENLLVIDVISYGVVFALLVACTAACASDIKALRKRGVPVSDAMPAIVFLLYVVGAPVYLIYRTVKARSTWLIPIAWFASVALAFGALYLFTNEDGSFRNPMQPTPALDVPALETDLAAEMRDLGARGVEVDCPDDAAYDDGDMVMCAVTTTSDGPLKIFLEMRNDGYYQWEVQQP